MLAAASASTFFVWDQSPAGKCNIDLQCGVDHGRLDDTVRLYRPRKEMLDGNWKFLETQPAK